MQTSREALEASCHAVKSFVDRIGSRSPTATENDHLTTLVAKMHRDEPPTR